MSTLEEQPAKPRRLAAWFKTAAIFFGCMAVIGGLYGGLAYRFWSNKPRITRDLVAELNAPIEKIPAKDRAWPKLRDVLVQLKPGLDVWNSSRQTPEDWLALQAFAAENQQAISELRESASAPRLGYIYAVGFHREDWPLIFELGTRVEDLAVDELPPAPVANGELLKMPLLPQQYLESAAALLVADCRRQPEAATIVTNFDTLTDVVRLMQDPPLQTSLLVSRKVLESSFNYLDSVLAGESPVFTDTQLKQLDGSLREILENRFPLSFADERAMFADLEQRCFTDDGQGDGYLYPDWSETTSEESQIDFLSRLVLPLAVDKWKRKSASRREFREKADELFTLANLELTKPFWEASANPPHVVEIDRLDDDKRWFLVVLMFPDFNALFANSHRVAMRADALRTAVALRRYKLRSGAWPDSLQQLVPDFLKEIPLDRFDGKPLRYKLQDGSPVLYSVFGDKVDDAGKPNVDTDPNADFVDSINPDLSGKGDLILWPELRPVEDVPSEVAGTPQMEETAPASGEM